MIGRAIQLVKQLITDPSSYQDLSKRIRDEKLIEKFVSDPDFPFFVSFPRTGSHWMRLMMELYFERPSLVRAFYFKDSQDFMTYHTHDLDLDVYRKNVIYLYRDPIPTIYSQLNFYQESTNDLNRIEYWSTLYAKHLSKWLIEETTSEKKTILRYENLKKNIADEFSKVTAHFGETLDPQKLQDIQQQVSKEEVKKKTYHDPRVISRTDNYEGTREEFKEQYGNQVYEYIFNHNPKLKDYFEL